ncbi:uncharacterized protein MELLADRAFT_106457 [Melampsora larici-populina 98AG31]|uniref:Uncharacterized protein n=1 Tax=Melampsora larici-populina (strain 98AG31 / pathotype 3-4-7) TaxID=747676 RepID=F4RLK3_MELLP|nr:uncharacterized protein MELLADRAFT_106457 [Melampsora larici-populina 98AG31]EGG06736.1 hypothetical protein MELLADRAFT_106457 [Melampsora larici-populina 98AG31]
MKTEDPLFLDVLLGKLRPNLTSEKYSACENSQRKRYLMDGYRWVSRCGPELNFLKADCTPVVYQNLVSHNQNELSYAGTLTTPFKPEMLRVDTTTGYVFHPSPGVRARYGNFSLLRSSLVLDQLGSSLTLDEEASPDEPVGWLDWQGCKWPIERLHSTDLGWPSDLHQKKE